MEAAHHPRVAICSREKCPYAYKLPCVIGCCQETPRPEPRQVVAPRRQKEGAAQGRLQSLCATCEAVGRLHAAGFLHKTSGSCVELA